MTHLEKAINRIKMLECPTGELENRVIDIFEEYQVADKNEITIDRVRRLDKDGTKAYSVKLSNNEGISVILLAKSGLDDYVVKIINVYIH